MIKVNNVFKRRKSVQENAMYSIGYIAFNRILSVQDDIFYSIKYVVFKRTQCVRIQCVQ